MPASSGRAARNCLGVGRAVFGQVPQHRITRTVQPRVTVVGDAGLLHVGDQPAAFVVGHPVAGRGLDQRQIIGADHPQRATHREVLDEAAPLVERGVEVGDGEAGQPSPQRQIRRGGIGGVQPDELRDRLVDRAGRRSEEMPPRQPCPPFGTRERPHRLRTVPSAPDKVWDR